MKKRLLAIALCFAMLIGSLGMSTFVAAAGKETPRRTIAIVYDNSGSMFLNKSKAWCQAQYAMEVFATMMNAGDKLMVYPMWPVVTESGERYSYQKNNPLIITEDSQKTVFHSLKSDLSSCDDTPIEVLDAAFKGLSGESGEKWLIILTDGDKYYENSKEMDSKTTKKKLEARISSFITSVNVVYLGIGKKLSAPQVVPPDGQIYFARTTSSERITQDLNDICNSIFGRDSLPDSNYTASTVNFDIPLSKLYIFIQGANISNVRLTQNGKEYKAVQTYSPKYGTRGCTPRKGYSSSVYNFGIDSTLQGQIAVFTDLKSGQYDFSYTGTKSSIAFYYEVDADLRVEFTNTDGKTVTQPSEIVPGDYYVNYSLVDENGNSLTSKLLGNVNYKVNYTVNGESKKANSDVAGREKIYIDENTTVRVSSVEVDFLNGYRIVKSGSQLGVLAQEVKGKKTDSKDLQIVVDGGQQNYLMSEITEKGVYDVSFVYDGSKLTGDALSSLTLDANVIESSVSCRKERTASGYRLFLETPNGVASVKPGDYHLSLSAVLKSATAEDSNAGKTVDFQIAKDDAKILSLDLSGGSDEYDADSISENAVYYAKFTYDGHTVTGEERDRLELRVSTGSDKITYTTEKTDGGFKITLGTKAELAELTDNEYKLTVGATMPSDVSDDSECEKSAYYWINDVSSVLKAEFEDSQTYFSLMEMDKAKPIKVRLTCDGTPLTEEQMQELTFSASAEGLPLITERVEGESAYLVSLDNSQTLKTGKYKIKVEAGGIKDRMGNTLTTENKLPVSVHRLPMWMSVIMWLLILILLILLIWYICTRPALPKNIGPRDDKVKIGGVELRDADVQIEPMGNGTRKRDITINCNADGLEDVWVKMTVFAPKGSYWTKSSSKRSAMILPDSVQLSNEVESFEIGTMIYKNNADSMTERIAGKDETEYDLETQAVIKSKMVNNGRRTPIRIETNFEYS